jgi:hypothetical protein
MYLDKRVNQGTSGRVYPQPFTDKLSSESEPQDYQAVYLENEYIRLMMLPQIGGRIHEFENVLARDPNHFGVQLALRELK